MDRDPGGFLELKNRPFYCCSGCRIMVFCPDHKHVCYIQGTNGSQFLAKLQVVEKHDQP